MGHLYQLWIPAWSPDGKKIAFLSEDVLGAMGPVSGHIEVSVADGGHPRVLTYTGPGQGAPFSLAWSPDGREICVLRPQSVRKEERRLRTRRRVRGAERGWGSAAVDGRAVVSHAELGP
jgi:dipeptidyl aminopeptidase/acylaminoacyl peptidase